MNLQTPSQVIIDAGDWPSWIQAAGVLIGLALAIASPAWQRRQELRDRKTERDLSEARLRAEEKESEERRVRRATVWATRLIPEVAQIHWRAGYLSDHWRNLSNQLSSPDIADVASMGMVSEVAKTSQIVWGGQLAAWFEDPRDIRTHDGASDLTNLCVTHGMYERLRVTLTLGTPHSREELRKQCEHMERFCRNTTRECVVAVKVLMEKHGLSVAPAELVLPKPESGNDLYFP